MNAKNLLIVLGSLLIVGCSGVDRIEISKVANERPKLNLSPPKPVKLSKVKFIVITPENAEEVFKKMEAKKYDLVLFGLTDDDYENLSINLMKLRNYIIQSNAIIQSYKRYYEPAEATK